VRRWPGILRSRCLCWTILTLAAIGCRGKTDSYERFVPSSPASSRALTAALSEWRDGKAPGKLALSDPKAWIIDSHRRAGQRLKRFEILGEIPFEHARCFAVRLTFENPDEQVAARFMVFGIEPLWIYRQEDYEMLAHWEHKMEDPALASPEPAR
jgi:hypothetical protein